MSEREKMEAETRLAILGDDPSLYRQLESSPFLQNCSFYYCPKHENIQLFLKGNHVQILMLNTNGTEEKDFNLLKRVKAADPLIDVVIIGDSVPAEKVIEWINHGALDYLIKPLQPEALQLILSRFDEKRNLRKDTFTLEKQLEQKYVFQDIVGKSPFMLEIFTLIEKCAKYFSTVLITGATGTGKEMVAKALHNLCPVKKRKFVICDCASLPDTLYESELFGYARGAFTGADRDKKGLFEEADKGVIFLDEIGEIPVSFQAKLLRVLESHQFRPLGSNQNRYVDVRVIASTNRNLREEVSKGMFREDLFHRINKVEIHLPLLKQRTEDIPLLVRTLLNRYNEKFIKQVRGLSREAQKLFLSYEWPGNVRELVNVIESASMLCKREFIDVADFPKYLQEYVYSSGKSNFFNRQNLNSLEELEREYIAFLLKINNNNIRKTAKILDISRTTLYSKLSKYMTYVPPS